MEATLQTPGPSSKREVIERRRWKDELAELLLVASESAAVLEKIAFFGNPANALELAPASFTVSAPVLLSSVMPLPVEEPLLLLLPQLLRGVLVFMSHASPVEALKAFVIEASSHTEDSHVVRNNKGALGATETVRGSLVADVAAGL